MNDRDTLIELQLAGYTRMMSDGYVSVFGRSNEGAADVVLNAGFIGPAAVRALLAEAFDEGTATGVDYARGAEDRIVNPYA